MRWRTDSKSHRENTLEDHLTNKLQKKAAEVCYKNKTGACIAYKKPNRSLVTRCFNRPPLSPTRQNLRHRQTDRRT
jgi:hypothetical protein